ncbi:MAG: hypothetical protein IH627_13055 [Rubrivivax sp.]|nr:hypothetical protein [Rubrivivax sp.]
MKKIENPNAYKATNSEVDHAHCTAPTQYAMRAECQADCVQMRSVVGRWLTVWREDRCYIRGSDSISRPIPDVDIVFSMSADAPPLDEVRWLLCCLVDCHVGAESLSVVSEYSGERVNHRNMPTLMRRPSDEVIREARDCVRHTKTCLRSDFSRLDDAIARLNAELGSEKTYLERRARQLAQLCKDGLGPEEVRNDDAKALAYGRLMAEVEWRQDRQ